MALVTKLSVLPWDPFTNSQYTVKHVLTCGICPITWSSFNTSISTTPYTSKHRFSSVMFWEMSTYQDESSFKFHHSLAGIISAQCSLLHHIFGAVLPVENNGSIFNIFSSCLQHDGPYGGGVPVPGQLLARLMHMNTNIARKFRDMHPVCGLGVLSFSPFSLQLPGALS
jgi:hypothetical protein